MEATQLIDGVVHLEVFLKVVKNDLGHVGCVLRRVKLTRLGEDSQLQRRTQTTVRVRVRKTRSNVGRSERF